MPLLFDTTVFILTLAKTVQLWRRDIHSRTISSFFRDGLIYFVGIFLMNLINVIIFVTQESSLQAVNLPATLMLNIILACRLVLNLRAPNKMESQPGSHNRLLYSGMGDMPSTQLSSTGSYGMDSVHNIKPREPTGNVVMINTFREVTHDNETRQWNAGGPRKPGYGDV